jgi:hypothetical protein
MGLYENMLERIRRVPDAVAFPELYTPPAPVEEEARLPRLSELPQTLLPPHLRRAPPTVDASTPAVQTALGNIPQGPNVPAALRTHAAMMTDAGLLRPLNDTASPFMSGPEAEMQRLVNPDARAEPVPLPMARPAAADAVPLPRPRPETSEEVGARARAPAAPVQIAPEVPPAVAAPQAGMIPGEAPSFLSRIASTLGDNSNTLLALGAGFAGAPGWGQAISRASAAAIPARAADISQSLARAGRGTTTRALIEAGVPVQQAISAQYDPDLKKSLIKNYIEDRASKIVEIGQDPNTGAKIFGQHDPFTKKITPIDMTAFKAAGGDATGAETDVTGPDYLQRLKETDPAHARKVEQIVNGDAPYPTGRQSQTPIGMRLLKDVLQVEPGSTQQDFVNRGATSKAYSSGTESRVTRSVNTTLKHAATLEKAINDLDNFSTLPGVLNPVRGLIAGQTSPAYQKALGAYQTAVGNFAKELDFVVSGGRPTVSGTKHQMEGFDPNAAKVLQLEKLRTGIDLLKGRLDSHAEGFSKGMKRRADPTDFIDPPNRKLYDRLIGGETPSAAAATPAAGGAVPKAPPPGTYVWDPATMKLVPAK